MKTLPILVALALMSAYLPADELPKFDVLRAGTKLYRGVKVTAVEPSGIRFTHDAGAGRAKFDELEPEVKSKFTIDPAKAAEFEAEKDNQKILAAADAQMAKTAGAGTADPSKLVWVHKSVIVDAAVAGGYLCYPHTPGGVKGSAALALNRITGSGSDYVRPSTSWSKPMFVTGIKGAVAVGQVLTGDAAMIGVKMVNGQPLEHWMSKP